MGTKGTINISRDEAILLMTNRIWEASNEDLSCAMEAFGFGEDINLPYFGHNFCVLDKIENENDDESYGDYEP